MKTKVLTSEIDEAASILQRGGLVAVPTETVYGLAGNGLSPEIIEKIYETKNRPAVKPISLMVAGKDAIPSLCEEVPAAAEALAELFWPGPLTLVLKAKEQIPESLRAGGETVGLRCPRQEQTLSLLRRLEFPLAVPSANPSGEQSPKSAEQVLRYFDGKIDAVIDGGACDIGLESTVLDLSRTPFRILRQGALPKEKIEDALADALQLVGITGGSGCGKTSALDVFRKHGALVIDADALYHQMLEENEVLLSELAEAFPAALEDGKLNRRKLGPIVFSDPAALQRLNAISHRHIGLAIRQQLRSFAMDGGKLAVLDAIELFGPGTENLHFDLTIAVTAPMEIRLARIMQRDKISEEEAKRRLLAQHPQEYFMEHCDISVRNDGDIDTFENSIQTILEERLHGQH